MHGKLIKVIEIVKSNDRNPKGGTLIYWICKNLCLEETKRCHFYVLMCLLRKTLLLLGIINPSNKPCFIYVTIQKFSKLLGLGTGDKLDLNNTCVYGSVVSVITITHSTKYRFREESH